MSWLVWFVVILVTVLILMVGAAILTGRDSPSIDRLADPLPLPGELPAAGYLPVVDASLGYLPGPPFAGAQDPAYQVPGPIPWDLAGAAYVLGQQRADQDAVSREVDAIMAEIESDPRWWR